VIPEPDQPSPRPIYGFDADMSIRTSEDSKPIDELRPRDAIQTSPCQEVLSVFLTRKSIFTLHLNGQIIHTTADHPFYVEG
jgi:hypothetical protein